MLNVIQAIKVKIGQEAENIIANGMGLEKVGKKYRCKNVLAHKNADKNPSMSWDPRALQFYCFACNEKIDIYRYYREFEHLGHKEILKKVGLDNNNQKSGVSKNDFKPILEPLRNNQIEYLLSRGITTDVIEKYKLASINNNIAIPYFKNSKIIGVKIKNLSKGKPKYYSVKGSVFGLFNKENIRDTNTLIITEGEFDCMIIDKCGYKNVVSVGSGAVSLSKLFQDEKDFLSSFEILIILSDNDESGSLMDAAFIKELEYKIKLPNKNLFLGCKDINEVFMKHGSMQINKIIKSAETKVEGLRNLDYEPYQGLESKTGRYIPTGLPSIDIALNDLAPGLVTLITGRSNCGKSTLINQIIANAIDTDNKVLLLAGEGLQEIIINNIYKTVIGRGNEFYVFKKINKRRFKEPKQHVLKALQEWHRGKFTIFNKGDSNLKTTDELFKILNVEVKKERHNLIVIDNLMSVLSVEKANEKLERQADFMQRCCDLAKAESIHIILVLHPNKTVLKGSSMDFEQISGTQDLSNKADNIIAVKRYYDEDHIMKGINGEIEVLKNRYFSDLPKIKVHFDEETGLLLEIDNETGDYLMYTFKWLKYLNGQACI